MAITYAPTAYLNYYTLIQIHNQLYDVNEGVRLVPVPLLSNWMTYDYPSNDNDGIIVGCCYTS